jgi:uroporphyrinogen-III synthase
LTSGSSGKTSGPIPCDLAGTGVLVTRPVAQVDGLCRLIETAGGRPIRFPAVAIEPAADPSRPRHLLCKPWDLIIYISRNAVECSLPLHPNRQLPAGSRIAAIGRATAKALADAGRVPDLLPADRSDSEALLALPELADLGGKRVLIVRGTGGRPVLGDTLMARGAELAYAEVYRRALPRLDPAPLLARWRRDVQVVTATSGEILDNLLRLIGGAGGRDLLVATPLVVVSERTAGTARGLGFARIELARRASDEAIVEALCGLVAPPETTERP